MKNLGRTMNLIRQRAHRWKRTAIVLLCLAHAGCGGGAKGPEGRDDSRNAEAYAADIKSRAVDLLEASKRQPQSGADNMGIFLEAFEGDKDAPVGDNAATYEKLKAGAEELREMFTRSAPANQTNPKIDELLALAKSLPGDLQPMGEAAERRTGGEID